MSLIYVSSRGVAGSQGIQGDPGPGVINWLGEWSDATAYEENDAVTWLGTSYICIVAHTDQEPPNPTYWDVLASKGDEGDTGDQGDAGLSIEWQGNWDSGQPYVVNDAVTLDGTSYICTISHTNQSPPNAGFWNVLAAKGSTGLTGNTGLTGPIGITWRGAWNSITSYALNDAVTSGGSAYICIQAHSNHQPPNVIYWDFVASKGDTGSTGLTGNTGNTGAAGDGFTWEGEWSGAETYQVRDVVQFDGSSYNCILGHTNQTPPNPTYWELMASKGDTGTFDTDPLTGAETGTDVTAQTVSTHRRPETIQSTHTFTNQSVTITDHTTDGGHGGVKIFEYPEGHFVVVGAVGNLTIARVGTNLTATAALVFSLGTTVAGIDNDTLTGTEADIIPSTAATLSGGTVTVNFQKSALQFIDGTAGAADAYFNVVSPDAGISGNDAVLVNGTVILTLIRLGDN